jgi:hypothetical protein
MKRTKAVAIADDVILGIRGKTVSKAEFFRIWKRVK